MNSRTSGRGKRLCAFAAVALLGACGNMQPAPQAAPPVVVKAPDPVVVEKTKIVDTGCDWTSPIYIDSSKDVLTMETQRQILNHNKEGEKRCGWKPKAKPALPASAPK